MKRITNCVFLLILISSCSRSETSVNSKLDADREAKIPSTTTKRGAENDAYPPILHSDNYEKPIPVPYPISTAGGEDSPFVLPDGNALYFWYTPDVSQPAQQQLYDGVSGIWVAHKGNGSWEKPTRVWLQKSGKLALDGAEAIWADALWFASAREGYEGINLFTARWVDGKWSDWRIADDFFKDNQVGELHLQGNTLYFHSARLGGKGQEDIWFTERKDGIWTEPINISAVNSDTSDSRPFITPDGQELWFTRTYLGTPAVYVSYLKEGEWGEPKLVVSQFAGEPSLDAAGNLYFVHHYFENGKMIEADIYVAYKK